MSNNNAMVALAALVFTIFAFLTGWMATWDLWTEGMKGLLVISSLISTVAVIGCVIVEWDEHRSQN